MRIIRKTYAEDPIKSDREHPKGKSKTQPDQTYTIRELLAKSIAGVLPPVGKTPYYTHDLEEHDGDIFYDYNPDELKKLDFDTLHKLRENNNLLVDKYKKVMQDEYERREAQKKATHIEDNSTTQHPSKQNEPTKEGSDYFEGVE